MARHTLSRGRRHQAGLTLVEAVAAISLVLATIPIMLTVFNALEGDREAKVAGESLDRVRLAAREYILDNYSSLASSTTATTSEEIDFSDLESGGYLPDGFEDRNVWDQEYGIYVLQPDPDRLQGLILTEGGRSHDPNDPDFGEQQVPEAASYLGAMGGYVPTGSISGESSDEVRGGLGTWVVDLGPTDIASPGAGHLGALVYFESGQEAHDVLYRRAVPGQPELNRMDVDLDMNGNVIEQIEEADFEDRDASSVSCSGSEEGKVIFDDDSGLHVCRDGDLERIQQATGDHSLAHITTQRPGTNVAARTCPSGQTLRYVTAQTFSGGDRNVSGNVPPSHLVQTGATRSGAFINLEAAVLTSDGWEADPDNVRVTLFQYCEE